MLSLLVFCAVLQIGYSQHPEQFRVIKEWRYVNFTWPSYQVMDDALRNKEYIPGNVFMAGIAYYKDYYYLALPRMKNGVPVTLGRIHVNSSSRPLVDPFPSWEMNKLDDCQALQNVQNVAVDAKSRMWIIDGGKTHTLSKVPMTNCDPKLVIINMDTNEIEEKYTFPAGVASKEISFLYDIAIDDEFAYITDNSRIDPGLIVYSNTIKKSWKIKHDSMRAEGDAIQFSVNEFRINAPINIAGLALGPKTHRNDKNITLNEDRELFYCPISSLNLYAIRTTFLKDEQYNQNAQFTGEVRTVGYKGGQTDGMKMDNKGVLYFGLLPTSSIVRWDSNTPFASGQKIIAKDPNYIQWPNSFAFDNTGNIVVLTNSLQKFVQNKMNTTEANFRVLKAFVNGKSYVYSDDTLVYSVHDTHGQGISIEESSSTTSTTTMESVKIEEEVHSFDDVTVKSVSGGSRELSIVLNVLLCVLALKVLC